MMTFTMDVYRILTRVAEETLNPDVEGEGECMFCGESFGHGYGCITQHARIILDMPLLKTKIERQWEDIKRQAEWKQWRLDNPEEAKKYDELQLSWLALVYPKAAPGLLQLLAQRVPQNNFQWVEE